MVEVDERATEPVPPNIHPLARQLVRWVFEQPAALLLELEAEARLACELFAAHLATALADGPLGPRGIAEVVGRFAPPPDPGLPPPSSPRRCPMNKTAAPLSRTTADASAPQTEADVEFARLRAIADNAPVRIMCRDRDLRLT